MSKQQSASSVGPEDDLFVLLAGGIGKADDAAMPIPAGALRAHLAGTFPFADQRCTRPGPARPFRIDDSSSGRDRIRWGVLATVPKDVPATIHLELVNCPVDAAVSGLVRGRGEQSPAASDVLVRLRIDPTDSGYLRRLAVAVRRTVGRGRRYADSNWKWLAPRTAAALLRLADCLDTFVPGAGK